MNKVFKYSTIFLLFMTSGLLFIVIGLIDNLDLRYKLFDVFQFGTSRFFDIVDWKFNTSKDNTILVSNYHIAPVVNLISSILWAGLLLIIFSLFSKHPKLTEFNLNGYWQRVVLTNFVISGLLFLFWLIFMDLEFIYDGVYSDSNSILRTIYRWLFFIIILPSWIPELIASITLDNGGDTPHGYYDLYLVSKTVNSFAVTFWAIIGMLVYDRLINFRRKRTQKIISQDLV